MAKEEKNWKSSPLGVKIMSVFFYVMSGIFLISFILSLKSNELILIFSLLVLLISNFLLGIYFKNGKTWIKVVGWIIFVLNILLIILAVYVLPRLFRTINY